MGEKIKLLNLILISLILNLSSYAEDSVHDAIPVSTVESLEVRLSELKSQNLQSLSYSEVTRVWKDISLLEPSLINEGELQGWEKKRSELLLDAGRLRYKVIDGKEQNIAIKDFLYDSYFELKIIPTKWLRLFEYKYLTIKSKLESGSSGLRTLLPELFTVFLFIFLPFIVFRINNWLLDSINALRDNLTNPQNFTASRQNFAIFLQRSGPFIPLALTIFALKILSNSFNKTILSEISILIPFILYYLYYRVFRQLIINFLMIFSEYVRVGKRRETQLKIFSSTKVVGRFFLSVVILLHLVSSVAGKGLLFQEIYFLSLVVSVFVYFWVVKEWTEEIDGYAKKIFVPQFFSFYEKLVTYSVLSFLIRTLSFAVIIFHPLYDYLRNKVLNFDFVKILVARLFQKKLEANENLSIPEETSLPEDYLQWFQGDKDDDESLWIDSKNQKVSEIQLEIDEWLQGVSEEHSLAIYGDKGIGKSHVLRHLESFLKKHEKAPEIILATVPPKINSKKDVLNFLGKLVGGNELNDVFELLDIDKDLNKKVIILDNAHNLFLTHFGGLKGIETFFEALSVRTDNIFWVASFNTYSWVYLDQVFHKNRFFRTVFKIKGFSDEELQDYILRRHNKTGYSLSYADIIRAVKTKSTGSELSYVENMFFRILWEQSHGNPELAEKMWLASLKPLYGKRFRVGLPLVGNFVVLNQLADESFFVFAALARHENLTTNEFIKVTDMKEGVVRHSLRIGLENGFVARSDVDRRYRFSVDGQYPVLNMLKAKNFIYE